MTDLIRRSDALTILLRGKRASTDIIEAIAALPAVTVGVKPLGSDGVKVHPQDILNAAWRDDLGEEGLAMYNRILAALEPVAAPDPAAIREAHLREAAKALENVADNWSCGHMPPYCDCTRDVEQWRFAADEILALISKGAADDHA